MLLKNRANYYYSSDEEIARWIEQIKPLHEDFIVKMEEKGLPGKEAFELVKELADKYNEIYK